MAPVLSLRPDKQGRTTVSCKELSPFVLMGVGCSMGVGCRGAGGASRGSGSTGEGRRGEPGPGGLRASKCPPTFPGKMGSQEAAVTAAALAIWDLGARG